MAGIPATLAHLKASGTLKHNAGKYANKADIKPSYPLGYPPKEWSDDLKAIWNLIRAEALPGTLGNSDRQMVTILCKLIQKERADIISTAERGQLIRCLENLGMAPSHRTRVSSITKKDAPSSPFATFASPPKTGTNG
jgi:hypothetical protein